MTNHLIPLFRRDLEKLVAELAAYPNEDAIWARAGEIRNPAGNLVLHLHGNLNHFVGKVLGGTDFVRDREAEFTTSGLPRAALIGMVEDTIGMLEDVLDRLGLDNLEQPYPLEVLSYPTTTGYFLIHLYGHLNWHLGQINDHRRLI